MPKNDFDQQTACGAPVCWLKYTTQGYLNNELVRSKKFRSLNGWLFRSWLDNNIIVCFSNIWYSDDDVTFNLAFFRLAGRGMETTSQEYDMDDVMVSRFDFIRIYSHLNLNHVYVSALLSGVAQINLINYLCYGRETCKASLNVPHCKICILTH